MVCVNSFCNPCIVGMYLGNVGVFSTVSKRDASLNIFNDLQYSLIMDHSQLFIFFGIRRSPRTAFIERCTSSRRCSISNSEFHLVSTLPINFRGSQSESLFAAVS